MTLYVVLAMFLVLFLFLYGRRTFRECMQTHFSYQGILRTDVDCMIDPFRRGIAWYKYKRLESDFANATLYFPFEKGYDEIWSEYFSDLIVRIGNSVDSFFRTMLKNELFDSFPHVSSLRIRRRRRDINYFRDFFEPIYDLSGVEVEIAYGLTFYDKKCLPFEEFKNDGRPNWWTAYNHVKHKWFDCIQEATLENTIKALAGLFVLNILHIENQQYLVRHTNVISDDFLRKEDIERFLTASMIGIPESASAYKIKAETPLFTHFFRYDKKAVASTYLLSKEG